MRHGKYFSTERTAFLKLARTHTYHSSHQGCARNSNLCVREADWKKRRSFALKVGSLLVRLHKRFSQQPQLPPFACAGSRIISIPMCRQKNALSSLSRRAFLYPSIRPSIDEGCSVFCVQPFFTANISYNDLVWKPAASFNMPLWPPPLPPPHPKGSRTPARGSPWIERRQEITCSGIQAFYLCGESGATHTDKRLLLIICLCECTISGALPFYSFGGCVRLNAFCALLAETFNWEIMSG